jgi:hypothetical protein
MPLISFVWDPQQGLEWCYPGRVQLRSAHCAQQTSPGAIIIIMPTFNYTLLA